MNRRQLLQSLLGLPLASWGGRLLSAPVASPRFLLVFLRGGYDAASLLVPQGSEFYYESRPNIAIAPPGPDANAALPLDTDWGLHPVLRDSLFPLYQAKQLAFVPFAGTDDLSRSHFETQDSIELGATQPGQYQSGFLNRLAAQLSGTSAISFTDQLPLIFRGELQVTNLALRQLGRPGLDARQSRIVATMYRNTPLAQPVLEGFATREDVQKTLQAEMDGAGRQAISTRGFEQEARRIAKLMRERYGLGFVDVGGWDTHVGQGAATGYLASRLDELGRGLAAFAEEMGPRWTDTVVVVVSEFGRTFRENGNRGTDHGHGSVYWVLGGSLAGGRVAGDQVKVAQASLFQNRDYPVLNDYRALLSGLFARWYGLTPAQLAAVFPGARSKDLGLL